MLDIKNINYEPSIDELAIYINNPLFNEFYKYMSNEYEVICKIEYSKDVWLQGWNIKFRKAGKSLCVVYPKENYFAVLVVVGNKEKDIVKKELLSFSSKVQEIYHNTKEGMGQRWLMIDLDINNDVYKDVLRLIQIRRENK